MTPPSLAPSQHPCGQRQAYVFRESEAQQVQVPRPRSHSKMEARLELQPTILLSPSSLPFPPGCLPTSAGCQNLGCLDR